MLPPKCALIFMLYMSCARAFWRDDLFEFDSEVEDDYVIEYEAKQEMVSFPETASATVDMKPQSELTWESVVHSLLEERLDKDKEEDELNEYDENHFMRSRDSRRFVTENLIRDILDNYELGDMGGKHRSGCPLFVKPAKHARTRCGSIKTMFGMIEWCHIQCLTGYKLQYAYPQFELCGEVTKYRWTYDLRGLSKGTERCIAGSANATANGVCTSKECMETAAYYMDSIDFSVNPCNDFYDFVCGRWLKETPIPPSLGSIVIYSQLQRRVILEVGDLLAQPYKTGECQAVKKSKIAYKACMNTDFINKLDAKPLLKVLTGRLSWPMIDPDWKYNSLFVEKVVGFLRGKYNTQVLLKVVVRKYKGIYMLQTWKGSMALPTSYYLDEKYVDKLKAYYELMRDVALMLGGERETVEKDVAAIRDFEKVLAYHKAYDKYNFKEMTIKELQKTVPGVMGWIHLFKYMIYSYPVTNSTKIQVHSVAYLQNLVALIRKSGKRFVKHRIKDLSLRFQERYLEFEEVLQGKKALSSRKFTCAKTLVKMMKGSTSKLFIDKYFTSAKKQAALHMFNYIRKGFIQLLKSEVTWMDKKTKNYAKKKALAMKPEIGYNPYLYENTTYLDSQVSRLKVYTWDYFGNTLRTLTSIAQDKFALIGTKFNQTTQGFSNRPTLVNAFYNYNHNLIHFYAALLQYPVYWGDKFPWSLQFGAVGSVLGHEFTHGFDDDGHLYGIHGIKHNWWSPSTLAKFKNLTNCMINQYNHYYFAAAGEYLNGAKTLSENIADNGGIREAYEGYRMWLNYKGMTEELLEPSTGLTNDQMFFVGFAKVQCGKYNHVSAIRKINVDTHSPGRFRVIGPIQNFEKFSKAFHCPLGSPMNPVKKCIIY